MMSSCFFSPAVLFILRLLVGAFGVSSFWLLFGPFTVLGGSGFGSGPPFGLMPLAFMRRS